jgi:hypothetical protein
MNAFCCGVAILQHGLPWWRRLETLSRVNCKHTLSFRNCCISRDCRLTGYFMKTCESVTFFLNCPVFEEAKRIRPPPPALSLYVFLSVLIFLASSNYAFKHKTKRCDWLHQPCRRIQQAFNKIVCCQ